MTTVAAAAVARPSPRATHGIKDPEIRVSSFAVYYMFGKKLVPAATRRTILPGFVHLSNPSPPRPSLFIALSLSHDVAAALSLSLPSLSRFDDLPINPTNLVFFLTKQLLFFYLQIYNTETQGLEFLSLLTIYC